MDVLQADKFTSLPGVRHGFFTRHGGVSVGADASLNCGFSSAYDQNAVRENRRRVAAHFGLEAECLLSCHQIHSPDVVTVDEIWSVQDRPRADAMVTAKPGLALGVLTADCVPVLFADAEAGVIGAAHAGWRGAVSGVIENTLAAMEKLGARRRAVRAALGPCIWQDSYEVGPEFPAPFLAEAAQQARFFRPAPRAGFFQFDLPGYVTAKLGALGVADVLASPADTCADPARFFSYRRNCQEGKGVAGSLISVVLLAG